MNKRYELIVIGAGPAGLSAAIEAAKCGMDVIVLDENARPGGQLFKQIHKFFGSKEHQAKIRGFRIGEELLEKAEKAGVKVLLNTVAMGIYDYNDVSYTCGDEIVHAKADNVIIATGASESMIPFDGWTLPGIIGAGAAQTLMNLHGVQPGKKILMIGSGNVGLVVGFQLLQAGCELAGVIEAAPRVGGYGVHASKLARAGVPFYTSHTIVKAEGEDHVTGAVIAEVDGSFKPVAGTEQRMDVDTICMAVGLSPMSQLARMAGCESIETPTSGGIVPKCNEYGETSIPGIFVAGDVAGIEEASSAMITGRIAGSAAACRSGYLTKEAFRELYEENQTSLFQLRQGMFCKENKGRTDLRKTDEGCTLSQSLLKKGYIAEDELAGFSAAGTTGKSGIHPVIECTQNIPCNPCQDACRFGCIRVGSRISDLPELDPDKKCVGCGICVASCPGQAIFLIDEDCGDGTATVTLPYEFSPLPSEGTKGKGLDRAGQPVCDAEVVKMQYIPQMDHTALLTMRVPKDMSMKARFFRVQEGEAI
ncbi:MAG: FAD-dependent oxidoreductase [Lawsonibacter sp.]